MVNTDSWLMPTNYTNFFPFIQRLDFLVPVPRTSIWVTFSLMTMVYGRLPQGSPSSVSRLTPCARLASCPIWRCVITIIFPQFGFNFSRIFFLVSWQILWPLCAQISHLTFIFPGRPYSNSHCSLTKLASVFVLCYLMNKATFADLYGHRFFFLLRDYLPMSCINFLIVPCIF